ncbi:MAG: hypothetical protein FWC93_07375 [Defluviitaleaceae bacterium]|nr:hypothetical protein [Defluviitaleaceae bacterium]
MKTLRKVISMLMALVMMFCITIPANAQQSMSVIESFVYEDEGISVASFVLDGNAHMLRTIEMDNGDVLLYEYFNGQLIHSGVIYANQNDRLYMTTYIATETARGIEIEAVETVEIFDIQAAVWTELLPEEDFYGYSEVASITQNTGPSMLLGSVTLRNLSSGAEARANVTFTTGASWQGQYTITNQTRTALSIAASAISILAFPASFAGVVAGLTVAAAGFATGTVGLFFFQHITLSAITTQFNYRWQNAWNPNHGGTFIGGNHFRYVINSQTHPQHFGQTYWSENSVTGRWRTPHLAADIAILMGLNPNLWHAVSWS